MVGEFGKRVDLSADASILKTISALFESKSEEVAQAASICLGNITIGNKNFYLKQVFDLVKNSNTQKYLFLNTIKEIIVHDAASLEQYIMALTELLES